MQHDAPADVIRGSSGMGFFDEEVLSMKRQNGKQKATIWENSILSKTVNNTLHSVPFINFIIHTATDYTSNNAQIYSKTPIIIITSMC